jgi:hypothetical protein
VPPSLPHHTSLLTGSDAPGHATYTTMRKTLRRSCDLCAKSKLRCDLLLPQCTRCTKRSPLKLICVYANTPLSSSLTDDITTISTNASPGSDDAIVKVSQSPEMSLSELGSGTFDPFESYPQIRLPRWQVQRLMQHCMFLFHNTVLHKLFEADTKQFFQPSLSSTIRSTSRR